MLPPLFHPHVESCVISTAKCCQSARGVVFSLCNAGVLYTFYHLAQLPCLLIHLAYVDVRFLGYLSPRNNNRASVGPARKSRPSSFQCASLWVTGNNRHLLLSECRDAQVRPGFAAITRWRACECWAVAAAGDSGWGGPRKRNFISWFRETKKNKKKKQKCLSSASRPVEGALRV